MKKTILAASLAGFLIAGCESKSGLEQKIEKRKSWQEIPLAERGKASILLYTRITSYTSEVESRLDEVKKMYSDTVIEPQFREDKLIGFEVCPQIFYVNDSLMKAWIEYIATGVKPKIPYDGVRSAE